MSTTHDQVFLPLSRQLRTGRKDLANALRSPKQATLINSFWLKRSSMSSSPTLLDVPRITILGLLVPDENSQSLRATIFRIVAAAYSVPTRTITRPLLVLVTLLNLILSEAGLYFRAR